MFWPQLLGLFRELISFLDVCSHCIHLCVRNSTCMIKITFKITI